VSDEGFQVNDKKTKVMRNPNKMIVTGLLINNRIRIPRKQLRIVRSFLHNCKKKGVKEISDLIGKDALLVAKGYLSFIKMVQPEVALSLEHKNDWIVSNKK
jgi:retron-type reverse transcriptase